MFLDKMDKNDEGLDRRLKMSPGSEREYINGISSRARNSDVEKNRPPGGSYQVVLGKHNLLEVDGSEYYLGVNAILIHGGWNPNDIASG
ncbi:hypothetical protein TURU_161858 [Turdus rufiventris]|nr:hypothetical protein TURU_161858 [Turdus rufiventris]